MKRKPTLSKTPRRSSKSDPAKILGGQPENDAEARGAGLKSATPEPEKKPKRRPPGR